MSGESSSLIELGIVGAPFGVRGWVKLRSFTDPPDRLLQHRSVQLGLGGVWTAYRIEASGRSGGQLTAKLSGIDDRDQAQTLRGAQVCVPRSELPQRDAKDFYRTDLIGCEVVNLAGVRLGIVQHFVETPAQVLMVVRGEQEYWVPAVAQHLRRVDLPARQVIVDWDDAAGA
ncbi:MAG TPA: ribosome maturation factor RimM [Steroidobacteraceae bacterium]|jgi:16S rRNA processing protein RimM|nr:ribosome maturation factor RimM [Steroidobacteraceae bacterium]